MKRKRPETKDELLEEARGIVAAVAELLDALHFEDGARNARKWVETYDEHHRARVQRRIARSELNREITVNQALLRAAALDLLEDVPPAYYPSLKFKPTTGDGTLSPCQPRPRTRTTSRAR